METIVGIVQDPLFGPVVMAGFGGVLVEVLGDVTFRVPPFGSTRRTGCSPSFAAIRFYAVSRGRPAVDERALAEAIVAVGRLALDGRDQLAEVDINPLCAPRRCGRPRCAGRLPVNSCAMPSTSRPNVASLVAAQCHQLVVSGARRSSSVAEQSPRKR